MVEGHRGEGHREEGHREEGHREEWSRETLHRKTGHKEIQFRKAGHREVEYRGNGSREKKFREGGDMGVRYMMVLYPTKMRYRELNYMAVVVMYMEVESEGAGELLALRQELQIKQEYLIVE